MWQEKEHTTSTQIFSKRIGPVKWKAAGVAVLALGLSSCAIEQKYSKPTAEVPTAYKEQPPADGQAATPWKTAEPGDQTSRGKWWLVYADPLLNSLEDQINVSNQALKVAEAQFREARAQVQAVRAGVYPTLTTQPSIGASQASANRSANSAAQSSSKVYGDFSLPVDVSYEPDLWGRVRMAVAGSVASAQAVSGDVENIRLSLQSELAADYFQLRTLDIGKKILDSTVESYQKNLELTSNRYKGGVASKVEVAQAETQLLTARAQDIDLGVQRTQLEHAIAVLIGKAPASFSIAPVDSQIAPPPIPAGVPSELLERRPDIAAAERRVAVANAQIGLARAAYYPVLNLTGAVGFEASHIQDWFAWPSHLFSVGSALAETVFDGGKRKAATQQAIAAQDAAVASYRESVLGALQEVEDNLAALHVLADEAQVQELAVKSAADSLALSLNRYKSGVVSYLEVITAQDTYLANQRTAVQIVGRQMVASVQLVKALGGGWDASMLPAPVDLGAAKAKASGASSLKDVAKE